MAAGNGSCLLAVALLAAAWISDASSSNGQVSGGLEWIRLDGAQLFSAESATCQCSVYAAACWDWLGLEVPVRRVARQEMGSAKLPRLHGLAILNFGVLLFQAVSYFVVDEL